MNTHKRSDYIYAHVGRYFTRTTNIRDRAIMFSDSSYYIVYLAIVKSAQKYSITFQGLKGQRYECCG